MSFKSSDGVAVRKVLLSLDDDTVAIFEKAGDGNKSLGARIVAQEYAKPKTASAPEPESKFYATVKRTRAAVSEDTPEQAERKQFLRKFKQKMEAEKLVYRGGGKWSRDGSPITSISALLKLHREHPDMKRYEELMDE